MSRDLVRFLPNERVDLPDLQALQENARTETRAASHALLLNSKALTANQRWVLSGFEVTADSPASALVFVAGGTAIGAYTKPDGTTEPGVFFGADSPASQSVDLSGFPAATYGIFVRVSFASGGNANRIFWDEGGGTEVLGALDTRNVASWDVQVASVSPGSEWQAVAIVVWNGATVNTGDITKTRRMFFEGIEPTYAHEWGDGANDRNTARGTYGVGDLFTFANAMRRQIEEIAGDGQKWYENFNRISATKFQIEGAATAHYWNQTNFVHQGLLDVIAPGETDPAIKVLTVAVPNDPQVQIRGRSGGKVQVQTFLGGDLQIESNGGGNLLLTANDTGGITMTCVGNELNITSSTLSVGPDELTFAGADLFLGTAGGGSSEAYGLWTFMESNPTVPSDVVFTTTKTMQRLIAGVTFVPDVTGLAAGTNTYEYSHNTNAWSAAAGATEKGRFMVSLDFIPNGCELTSVNLYGRVLYADVALTVEVIKVARATGAITVIATETLSGALDFPTIPDDYLTTGTEGLGEVIALGTHSYYVHIFCDNDAAGGNIQWRNYNLRVRWNQPSVLPG